MPRSRSFRKAGWAGIAIPPLLLAGLLLSALAGALAAAEVPEWGIAIMGLQANLPDNLPGQNATIVLFGDVEIANRGEDTPPLPDVFVTGGGVNVRQTPGQSYPVPPSHVKIREQNIHPGVPTGMPMYMKHSQNVGPGSVDGADGAYCPPQ